MELQGSNLAAEFRDIGNLPNNLPAHDLICAGFNSIILDSTYVTFMLFLRSC